MKIDLDKVGDNKDVKEVYSFLKQYIEESARTEWVDDRKKCWDVIENKQILTDAEEKEIKDQGQDPLIINDCIKGVQGSCAVVTDQKPEVKFHPIGSSDLYIAELLRRAFDVVWTKNEATDVTYDVVEEVKVGALGFFDAKHDPNLGPFGRIVIEESPPEDIYFDAKSRKRDLSDTHIIKAKLRTKTYIKENYENIKDTDLIYEADLKDPQKSTGVTGADNYAEGEKDRPDSQDGQKEPEEIWEIEAYLLKTIKEDWIITVVPNMPPNAEKIELDPKEKKNLKAGDKIREGIYWPRKLQKRIQRIIVGKKLIEEKENPYGMDADGNPVVTIIGLKGQRIRNAYAKSTTFYAKEINRDRIKKRMLFHLHLAHGVGAPIVEPAAGTKWIGSPGTPGSRVQVSQATAFQPHRMTPGAVQAGLFTEAEKQDKQDIDEQYDQQDVMKGKLPQGQVSGRTILALQDTGAMMSKPFLRALESALVRLAKAVIAMILKHWPRYMWERLIEPDEMGTWTPDGKYKDTENPEENEELKAQIAKKWMDALEKIRPMDATKEPGISLIDLDVKLTAGSSMPTNRIAKGEMAIEYMGAGIYDRQAALEYIDDPKKDEIIARMKKQDEMMMQQEMMKGGKK